jgi:threonine/homoserine/homoserine lactone efflux protein
MANLNLPLFFGIAIPLLLVPGPAVIFISTQSISRGTIYGVASASGIAVGGLAHVLAAALGLSAILATSATAFLVTKYLGALYLIYLGISKIRQKQTSEVASPKNNLSPRSVFVQGIWVQILNPKIALFFMSFLPQFIDATSSSVTRQTIYLGMGFVVLGFTTDSAYALLAAKLQSHFQKFMKDSGATRWFSGLTFIGLGIYTAITGSKKTA